MSQPKLTLRPPPNVEYVQGFPGIPPAAPKRPQAAVKGTLELRLGPQGHAKAKYVSIELRKIESLPGGGQANSFFDTVGVPIKVWEAQGADEWDIIHTRDFNFEIRIPESVPPTIQLEKGAGIRYELVASTLLKGKKGFMRRSSSTTLTVSEPVIIDKHELHSTWPIYSVPDRRVVTSQPLTLTVERDQTCYGPSDRVVVLVTLKSDNLTPVVLRAFELTLKETIIFKAGHHASGKKGAPQVRTTHIGEQKVPVNVTLYGGTQNKAELSCIIPQTHTTTTVNAARHIDITYSIVVQAIMGVGKPILMELPVTVSNWQRNVSLQAIKLIGPSPNLSSTPGVQMQRHAPITTVSAAQNPTPNATLHVTHFNTMPSRSNSQPLSSADRSAQTIGIVGNISGNATTPDDPGAGDISRSGADEFGRTASWVVSQRPTSPVTHEPPPIPRENNVTQNSRIGTNSRREDQREKYESSTTRPNARKGELEPVRSNSIRTKGAETPSSAVSGPNRHKPQASQWPSAEDEKQRLFRNAIEKAERVQAGVDNSGHSRPPTQAAHEDAGRVMVADGGPFPEVNSKQWAGSENEKSRLYNQAQSTASRNQALAAAYSASLASAVPQRHLTAEEEKQQLYQQAQATAIRTQALAQANTVPPPTSPPQSHRHLTAEEEKARLFYEAQASAQRVQSLVQSPPPSINHVRSTSNAGSTGAQLYSNAISSLQRNQSGRASVTHTSPMLGNNQSYPQSSPPFTKRFATAEEEKAALRYYEAKRAVERSQGIGESSSNDIGELLSDGPIAYDALYPSETTQDTRVSSPPPITGHSQSTLARQPSLSVQERDRSMMEKEKLRRRFEQLDATAPAHHSMQTSITSNSIPISRSLSLRSPPMPPSQFNGSRPLTAAEEKAHMRAQYEAQDARSRRAMTSPPSTMAHPYTIPEAASFGPIPTQQEPTSDAHRYSLTQSDFNGPLTPPPLMPRPPEHYIQETQEEDARTQAEDHAFKSLPQASWDEDVRFMDEKDASSSDPYGQPKTPKNDLLVDGIRPPLPPKIPIEH